MKFSLHLSNVALALLASTVLGFLLLADIAMRSHESNAASVASASTSDRVVTKELVLTDSEGRVRARLALDENDAPSLQLLGKDGQKRTALRLNRNDVPSLRLYDDKGNARSIIGFTLEDMNPAFVQFNENGEGRALTYSTLDRANPAFAVGDEDTVGLGLHYIPTLHRADPFAYHNDAAIAPSTYLDRSYSESDTDDDSK